MSRCRVDRCTTNKRRTAGRDSGRAMNVGPDPQSRVSDTTFSYVWIASFAPSIRVCRARACLTMSMSVHRLRERCDYERRTSPRRILSHSHTLLAFEFGESYYLKRVYMRSKKSNISS